MSVPNPAGAPHPRAVIFREDVDLELVRYLYRQAPSSILVLLTVGAIMAYVLWDLVAHDAMLAWLGLLAVVSAVRFAQIAAFRWRAPTRRTATSGRCCRRPARCWSEGPGRWRASCSWTRRIP
jgi:poly(3-hydroxyalkanoate) synthetase